MYQASSMRLVEKEGLEDVLEEAKQRLAGGRGAHATDEAESEWYRQERERPTSPPDRSLPISSSPPSARTSGPK